MSDTLEHSQQNKTKPETETRELSLRLRQEIEVLTQQQSKARERAIYVGMTPDEANEYDARREKIMTLMEHWIELGKVP